jgi:hypothetical protein
MTHEEFWVSKGDPLQVVVVDWARQTGHIYMASCAIKTVGLSRSPVIDYDDWTEIHHTFTMDLPSVETARLLRSAIEEEFEYIGDV